MCDARVGGLCKAVARDTGATAKGYDSLERDKYSQTGKGACRFVPLSHETFGRAGHAALALLPPALLDRGPPPLPHPPHPPNPPAFLAPSCGQRPPLHRFLQPPPPPCFPRHFAFRWISSDADATVS